MRTRALRRGAAAIEFAFVVPVYLALVCTIADWCWFVYCQATVQDITVRAARAGALSDPRETPSPAEVAEDEALSLLAASGFDTSTTIVDVTQVPNDLGWGLDIEVRQPFQAPTRVVSAFVSLDLVGRGMVHGELAP